MKTLWMRYAALVAVFALAGCNRNQPTPTDVVIPEDLDTRLGSSSAPSLKDWLKKSRVELARLANDQEVTVAKQRKQAVEQPATLELLPDLSLPADVPVLQKVRFSSAAKISVPVWLDEGQRDRELALHLALYGDHEAAAKVAPEDDKLKETLARLRKDTGTTYPLEWSRLVGLAIESSTWKMASGDIEGANELVQFHKELREILDPRTTPAPLRHRLLSAGRRALGEAVVAWRGDSLKKTALAGDVETALKDWGEVPTSTPLILSESDPARVAGLLSNKAEGTLRTPDQKAVDRFLDLAGLDVPAEGVQDVFGFLDAKGNLSELLLVYRRKIETVYPKPIHLGYWMVEGGARAKDPTETPGVLQQTFESGDVVYEAAASTRTLALGGFVMVRSPRAEKPAYSPTARGREFGPARLDCTFETNRQSLAPRQPSGPLEITDKATAQQLVGPIGLPLPNQVRVQPESKHDLVNSFTFTWGDDLNAHADQKLLPALWSALGPAKVVGEEGAGGSGVLSFTWSDDLTQVRLNLPFAEKAPELLVKDARGESEQPARLEAARKRDLEERKKRLAAGKPLQRLPRSFGDLNDLAFPSVTLGDARSKVEAELGSVRGIRKPLSDKQNLSFLFTGTPPTGVKFWAGQMIIRFGPGDLVAEIRVRYQDHLPVPGKAPTLLQTLEAGNAGKPGPDTPEWVGLWTDRPGKKTITKLRWQDDLTIVTFQDDGGSMEVIRRDRPVEKPEGVDLPPLTLITPGFDDCRLGMTRAEIQKAHKTRTNTTTGADSFALLGTSPYQFATVEYGKDDRVVSILAGHRAVPKPDPAEVSKAIQAAWARDLDRLGLVHYQEPTKAPDLAVWFWHDDRVRVKIFAQDSGESARLFTEWRYWPIPEEKK